MNDRRPYDDDPHGRHSAPQGRPQVPGPRTGSPNANGDPRAPGRYPQAGGYPQAGRHPSPEPRPGPQPGRDRDIHHDARPYEPQAGGYREASQWDAEEDDTRMVAQLGYVPPEARHSSMTGEFDVDSVTAADRTKYRTRKRAKKASPLAKLGTAGIVVVVVLALIGGIWWLNSGSGDGDASTTTYSAVNKPCEMLQDSSLEAVPGGDKSKQMRNESKKKTHKSEQTCDVILGSKGSQGSLQIYSEVFSSKTKGASNAGAQNTFEHGAKQAKATAGDNITVDKVKGVADGAFAVSRVPSQSSKTVDYSLHLVDDNAYLYTRVALYKGSTAKDAAKYAKTIATDYLSTWRG